MQKGSLTIGEGFGNPNKPRLGLLSEVEGVEVGLANESRLLRVLHVSPEGFEGYKA